METIKKYRDMRRDTIEKLYPLWKEEKFPDDVRFDVLQGWLVQETGVYNYNIHSFINHMIDCEENEKNREAMEERRKNQPQLITTGNNSNGSDYDDLPF